MKSKFEWYLKTGPDHADEAWKKGILTVDANVLLDLYRYHTATRESIISALEAFKDRVWISYQAAHEFVRNRKKVIASSEKTFRDAAGSLNELANSVDGAISKLRGYRLVPRPEVDGLSDALRGSLDKARGQFDEARSKYPDYLGEDPILTRILALFDGRVGERPSVEEHSSLIHLGEQRRKNLVPPGYLDDDKDGDRKYGDFLLWSQIMDYAKVVNLPIILVTSERKEDWWEKSSGKTLGPRLELIEEFHESTSEQVFIYQTENFITLSAEHAGTHVPQDTVQEIRELNVLRARQRQQHAPAVSVEQLSYVEEPEENSGIIEIELMRELFMMTGSGRFKPEMVCVPQIEVSVMSAPEGCPELNVRTGTGTTFDFNVHVRSAEKDRPLPVGTYLIEYVANCDDVEPDQIEETAANHANLNANDEPITEPS